MKAKIIWSILKWFGIDSEIESFSAKNNIRLLLINNNHSNRGSFMKINNEPKNWKIYKWRSLEWEIL